MLFFCGVSAHPHGACLFLNLAYNPSTLGDIRQAIIAEATLESAAITQAICTSLYMFVHLMESNV